VTVELRRLEGRLDDERLGWIARLYGPTDAKYRSLAYVRHQFAENPFGWSVNVFAVADGEPVGHCGVVPFRARLDGQPFTAGKLEALAVAPSHRGRRPDGGSVSVDVLRALYALALATEMRVIFGLAPPRVGGIHVRAGCTLVPVDAPSLVLVTNPSGVGAGGSARRRLAAVLAAGQGALLAAAAAGAVGEVRVREPGPADADLAEAAAPAGAWTVSGADAWEWYAGSGALQVVEVAGRHGSRALVRIGEAGAAPVQIVGWRAEAGGRRSATALVAALAALARRAGAPTLRFQPWRGSGDDGTLARACARLGFVRRSDFDLLVKSDDEGFPAAAAAVNPFFYVTF